MTTATNHTQGRVMTPQHIAAHALQLHRAHVPVSTLEHIARTVDLAGVRPVIHLGDAVVDGPEAGSEAVRALLRALVFDAAPNETLRRIIATRHMIGASHELITGVSAEHHTTQEQRP